MHPYHRHGGGRIFGTWPLKGDVARASIEAAIEIGYRAFDTAQLYANEAELGQVLAASGLAREDYCVTTKVLPAHYSEEAFLPSVENSLEALGLDRVDVLLLHWPDPAGDNRPTLEWLQEAKARGWAERIGVSNYTIAMLKEAQGILEQPIAVDQVEFHPLLDQAKLLRGASALGVPLSAYCSIARGAVFESPELADIGAAYDKSPAQVAQRWILQKGVAVNTMSTKKDNIRANFEIFDFSLSNVDMARIDALGARGHRICNADLVPWAPEWD